jgi:hypothetical protein
MHAHAHTRARTHQAVGFAVGSRAAKRWSKDAFDTLTEYVHPPRQVRRVHCA